MIKILDVCSGIGGFSLGLEATGGFDTVAFCEFDEFCGKVLKKHWPDVPIYKDLKEIGNEPTRLIQEFDLICGGIPCQPFSLAGKQKGKEDDRHLWPYMYEIIKHKKPTWVIVENVGGFVNVALDDVCLDLETEGYATQSFIIPACGVEAPHRRERVWILGKLMANTNDTGDSTPRRTTDGDRKETVEGWQEQSQFESSRSSEHVVNSKRNEHSEEIGRGDGEAREDEKRHGEEDSTSRISSGASGLRVSDQGHEGKGHVADPSSKGLQGHRGEHGLREASEEEQTLRGGEEQDVPNTESVRGSSDNNNGRSTQSNREGGVQSESGGERSSKGTGEDVSHSGGERGRSGQTDRQDAKDVGELTRSQEHREGNTQPGLGGMDDGVSARLDGHQGFITEPDIPRVAEKIPDRVNRLKALGNSIVPQIIYHIGMAILEEERKNENL